MPVDELIRLVRLYSTPWEQKSTALKKLHQDYETKKAQLNIAVKRLQLINGQVNISYIKYLYTKETCLNSIMLVNISLYLLTVFSKI